MVLLLLYLCPPATDRRYQGGEMHVAQVQHSAELYNSIKNYCDLDLRSDEL